MRIALASIGVTALAVGIITIGVFVFASSSFERLMVEHGSSVAEARSMFDDSVAGFFLLAAAGGVAGSVLLALLLARWLSAPLSRISGAAERMGRGPLGTGPSIVSGAVRSPALHGSLGACEDSV